MIRQTIALLLVGLAFALCAARAEEVILSSLIDVEAGEEVQWVVEANDFEREPAWDGISPLPISIETVVQKARDALVQSHPKQEIIFRSVAIRPPVKNAEKWPSRFAFVVEFDLGKGGQRLSTVVSMTGRIVEPKRQPLLETK